MWFIEVELQDIPESVTEGIREAREAGRGTDEGESRYIHLHARTPCTRADHDINLEIFHRRVEDFFDLWLETVNLIDKEDFSFCQTGEKGYYIRLFFYRWPARMLYRSCHLMCYDGRYGGLSESRWSIEEDMFERSCPYLRRAYRYF